MGGESSEGVELCRVGLRCLEVTRVDLEKRSKDS